MGGSSRNPTTIGTNVNNLLALDEIRIPEGSHLPETHPQDYVWSQGLVEAMVVALSFWAREPHSTPRLRVMTPAQWKEHINSNHEVYKKECATCVTSRGTGAQHRRVHHPEAYVLTADVAGPIAKGLDPTSKGTMGKNLVPKDYLKLYTGRDTPEKHGEEEEPGTTQDAEDGFEDLFENKPVEAEEADAEEVEVHRVPEVLNKDLAELPSDVEEYEPSLPEEDAVSKEEEETEPAELLAMIDGGIAMKGIEALLGDMNVSVEEKVIASDSTAALSITGGIQVDQDAAGFLMIMLMLLGMMLIWEGIRWLAIEICNEWTPGANARSSQQGTMGQAAVEVERRLDQEEPAVAAPAFVPAARRQDDQPSGSASLPLSSRAPVDGRFSRRQAITLAFPSLPDYLVDSCRQLSVGSLTPQQRANRAWLAGCWARAVLDGQVDKPDPSEPLDVSSRYDCVLRAEGLPSPVVCGSLSAFRRVVGPVLGRSVTHGFPFHLGVQSVMDFAQLVAYESGPLEVLEFSWPPAAEDQEERDLGQQPAEGNWIAAQDQERLSALVVDMADHMAEQLAPADLSAEELVCFRQREPMLFPLASEVLKQSKEWLLGTGNLPEDRSGYHTAASATEAPAPRPKPPKPKRPTVQQLAAQQAQMMQLMTSVVERLDGLQAPVSPAPGPPGPTASAPPAAVNTAILQKPLASVLPRPQLPLAFWHKPSALHLLPVLSLPRLLLKWTWKRRLQEELASRSGAFADKIRANMGRRMDPTHLMAEEQISFMRYLERHGAFSAQPLLGLLAWQTAQALDLLAAGSEAGARDTLSLILLMMEQTALDGGNSSLSWLLTLQAEPPQSLFQVPASVPGAQLPVFSALAEQKWVTTALAYAKELDTISVRRSEAQAKGPGVPKTPSKPAPPPPAPPGPGDLTKKQQRAVGKAVFLGWCPWTLDYLYLRSLSGLPFAAGSSLREEGEFTFESWIAALPRLLKRGKTQLSGFLVSTLNLRKGTSPDPSAALYPLPLLHEGVFHQRSCRNASDRRALAVRRCVPLNPAQAKAYRRIELSEVVSFVERCGLTPGAYPGDGALPEEVLHFAGLEAPHPTFAKEKPDHLIGICKLWDASSLLGFVPGPLPDKQLTRLFGAYKAPGKLRQIGDRRGQNASEAHLCGPSRFLPSGPLLCRVHVPAGCSLVGSVTDRRDFYTQAMISEERSWTNAVGPALPLRSLLDTVAGQALLASGWSAGLRARASCLPPSRASLLVGSETIVHPTFRSLLQGDAGGVEYATGGHQGLIIDDFFCLSVEAGDFVPGSPSSSLDALSLAKLAYESEEVAGATYLGFPTQKRLSLAAASVRAAECPCISEELVSCLTGSWVSALMYRVAGELQLLSVLAPVILTNLSAAPSPRVYASVSVSQGALSENLGRLGFYAGPVIDPTRSRHFRHTAPRLLEWILFLLSEKRPPLRSAACPEGFDATEPRTREGNKLALAHLCLLRAALRCAAGLQVSEAVLAAGPPGTAKMRVLSRGLQFGFGDKPAGETVCREGFAGLLAKAFAGAISEPRPAEPDHKRGLENLAVNDLLLTAPWKTEACWRWRRNEHINCREAKAAQRVVSHAAAAEGDSKVSLLLDSSVARGAIGKGRSPSKALRPILLRTGAVAIAGGVHLGLHHAPTRLNVADDPTRDAELRLPGGSSLVCDQDPDVVEELCNFAGLRQAGFACLSSSPVRTSTRAWAFREKGPSDRGTSRTKLNRASLLDRFSDWLGENGFEREAFMQWPAETLAKTLEQFGRELFEAGRPYWHYAETINAISARRPAVRRTLQGAWDLAFSWLALEPYTHHVAMPAVILLALLSVCLTWGWRAEAGIFALAWGALLRIGEATGAVRSSLVLPRDTLWSQAFILLKIDEPKTRLRTARHQAAKVEAQDLVQLIDLAFAHLPAYSKLWPLSAQTLRKRLDSALEALQATEDAELVRRRGTQESLLVDSGSDSHERVVQTLELRERCHWRWRQ
ncbi:unnamed protein product, partial [Symbiodinium necroappetens]